jgi:hypothetical protein
MLFPRVPKISMFALSERGMAVPICDLQSWHEATKVPTYIPEIREAR